MGQKRNRGFTDNEENVLAEAVVVFQVRERLSDRAFCLSSSHGLLVPVSRSSTSRGSYVGVLTQKSYTFGIVVGARHRSTASRRGHLVEVTMPSPVRRRSYSIAQGLQLLQERNAT
jgi:hypothetical protein